MQDRISTDKYEAYKAMKSNLKKAMNAGFYYQAIFIEYAITEDRCLSALKHSGVNYLDSKGREIKLAVKLNKMRSNPAFTIPVIRKRIPEEFLDSIIDWKRDRDQLIHKLAAIPYDHDSIKEVAERGEKLVKMLDNKVNSINRYYDKRNSQSEL